uniref:3-methyl-2-oxobutanoate hydroxymethyltransferase n=1 Tax=Mycena chlorophos TaxID=658473 RepID=A0ABQ0MDB8_MYCCL|nr:3-methyl-2-oxobutanoate hydroxymethyltransferase [Mycena chlorophos]
MFCSARRLRHVLARPFASSAYAAHPNLRADLDPALRDLLRDVDITLNTKKRTPHPQTHEALKKKRLVEVPPQEYQGTASVVETEETQVADEEDPSQSRRSPAAEFGRTGFGAVVLPFELEKSINLIISESDKRQLHSDAERLFLDKNTEQSTGGWNAEFDTTYSTGAQSRQHAERDGSAFASIALPAHFSAITAVLGHLKRRLEPEWRVERIIDWGAATGSGLWSSAYTFQEPNSPGSQRDTLNLALANTTLREYVGIDKREGLVTVGKRLLRNIDTGALRVSWRKSLHDNDIVSRSEGGHTVALSAFMLSSLSTHVARKALIKEMWSSGADVLVIIDHNTTEGFEAVAQARETVLTWGAKEVKSAQEELDSEDQLDGSTPPHLTDQTIHGCHVVAPCPHDRPCPLFHPGDTKLVCGFSQRLQRPAFVRLTKHSGQGHEDMGYSYVVLRRGPRPAVPNTNFGRVGRVGQAAIEREREVLPVKELFLHDETEPVPLEALEQEDVELDLEVGEPEPSSANGLEDALRKEAYHWPRLIFQPIKNSGHIILDACTPEGKVMRMTIPKSQGKQPFYDARKAQWGDVFPHPPKNAPQERYQPQRSKGRSGPIRGADIGKRSLKANARKGADYTAMAEELKAARKESKRERQMYRQKWGESRSDEDDDNVS